MQTTINVTDKGLFIALPAEALSQFTQLENIKADYQSHATGFAVSMIEVPDMTQVKDKTEVINQVATIAPSSETEDKAVQSRREQIMQGAGMMASKIVANESLDSEDADIMETLNNWDYDKVFAIEDSAGLFAHIGIGSNKQNSQNDDSESEAFLNLIKDADDRTKNHV